VEAITSLELAMCVQVSFDQLLRLEAVQNKRIAVSGLGPAGLIAVQMARSYGAREVIGIDPLPERRALALQLGAHVALPPDPTRLPAGRFEAFSLETAIDCTGLKTSIEFLLERVRETVTIFGVLREDITFGAQLWRGGFALLGYGQHNQGAARRALDLIRSDQLKLAPLLTHRLPLSQYSEGVALLRSKAAVKVLFLPWTDPL
jgi:threonine dehydrogenase-like Zn-dependent dehydrogenase